MNKFEFDANKFLISTIQHRAIFGIDILVNNYCNLNCKCCNRWCNITKNKQIYKTQDIIQNVLHILNNTKLQYLTLTGGEPLLHPDIIELVKFLGQCKKKYNLFSILIQSNVLRIPKMPPEFFQAVRDADLTISWVRYNYKHVDYDEIFKRLDDENVKHISTLYLVNASLDTKPITDTMIMYKYSSVKNQKPFVYKRWLACCDAVPALWQGKLYKCTSLPFIDTLTDNFNVKFEVIENDDYIKVENINTDSRIFSWKNKPSSFCKNYCSSREETYTNWAQGKNTKEELISENE